MDNLQKIINKLGKEISDYEYLIHIHSDVDSIRKSETCINLLLSELDKKIIDEFISQTDLVFIQSCRQSYVNRLKNLTLKYANAGHCKRVQAMTNEFSDIKYLDNIDLLENGRSKDDIIYINSQASSELDQMQKISREMCQIQELFLEMNNLTEIQHENIQLLAPQTVSTLHGMDEGLITLQVAEKHAVAIRKKKLLVVALIIGAIGVTLAAITAIGVLIAASMGLFA